MASGGNMFLNDYARRVGAARAFCLGGAWSVDALREAGVEHTVRIDPLGGVPVACADVREAGRAARAGGALAVVDLTGVSSYGCEGARLAGGISVERLGDVTLVGVSRAAADVCPGLLARCATAAEQVVYDEEALAAEVERRGSAWHTSSDTAQVVAAYVRCHPRVREVRYPGLKGDASFAVAARTLTRGFGPWVDYTLVDGGAADGDTPAWYRFDATTSPDPIPAITHLESQLKDAPRLGA